MLYLTTSGSKYSKRLCTDVILWFIGKYLPRHKLDLTVHHRGLLSENSYGFCDIEGKTYKPRTFIIELHNHMNKKDYIKTLLHELWHLYQFTKEELKIKSCKRYYKGINVEDIDYENQPHEIIAYQKEQELYEEYLTTL